jgi:hypothetical protein
VGEANLQEKSSILSAAFSSYYGLQKFAEPIFNYMRFSIFRVMFAELSAVAFFRSE